MNKKMAVVIVLIIIVLGISIIYFKFIAKNNNKTNDDNKSKQCYSLWKIETGPELTASQDYISKCTSKKNKEDCELVDVYSASTNNFGNSDGIIDCEWR